MVTEKWTSLQSDGLYITIPEEINRSLCEIVLEIAEYGVFDISFAKIKNILLKGKGQTIRLAQEIEPFERDDIKITLSDDEAEAYITTEVPSRFGRIWFLDLVCALQKAGVVFGIDFEAIENIANDKKSQERKKTLVAKEQAFVQGRDAFFDHNFDVDNALGPLDILTEEVSFDRIGHIERVFEGNTLIIKKPATKGQAGIKVTGKIIEPTPGHDKEIIPGQNTKLNPMKTELRATVDGHAYIQNGICHVQDLVVIKGHVDASTGDVNTKGQILVMGTVLPGFTLTAERDIMIMKDVKGSSLISKRGNIIIKGGIWGESPSYGKTEEVDSTRRGKPKTRSSGKLDNSEIQCIIQAGGNIEAEFASDAKIISGADVLINAYLTNCEVDADGDVIVTTGHGLLVGGSVASNTSIEVNNLGTMVSNQTIIIIKRDAEQKVLETIDTVNKKISEFQESCKKLSLLIKESMDKINAGEEPNELVAKQKLVTDAHRVRVIQNQILQMENEKKRLEERLITIKQAKIIVHRKVYPGVTVIMHNVKKEIKEIIQSCCFRLFRDEIQTISLEQFERLTQVESSQTKLGVIDASDPIFDS